MAGVMILKRMTSVMGMAMVSVAPETADLWSVAARGMDWG